MKTHTGSRPSVIANLVPYSKTEKKRKSLHTTTNGLLLSRPKNQGARSGILLLENGLPKLTQDPFEQTLSDSPWKLNHPFTLVLVGAPK